MKTNPSSAASGKLPGAVGTAMRDGGGRSRREGKGKWQERGAGVGNARQWPEEHRDGGTEGRRDRGTAGRVRRQCSRGRVFNSLVPRGPTERHRASVLTVDRVVCPFKITRGPWRFTPELRLCIDRVIAKRLTLFGGKPGVFVVRIFPARACYVLAPRQALRTP